MKIANIALPYDICAECEILNVGAPLLIANETEIVKHYSCINEGICRNFASLTNYEDPINLFEESE